jgi:hypothetical protein
MTELRKGQDRQTLWWNSKMTDLHGQCIRVTLSVCYVMKTEISNLVRRVSGIGTQRLKGQIISLSEQENKRARYEPKID